MRVVGCPVGTLNKEYLRLWYRKQVSGGVSGKTSTSVRLKASRRRRQPNASRETVHCVPSKCAGKCRSTTDKTLLQRATARVQPVMVHARPLGVISSILPVRPHQLLGGKR